MISLQEKFEKHEKVRDQKLSEMEKELSEMKKELSDKNKKLSDME